MANLIKNNRGISLVELLVALAIGSIAVSAVVILMGQGVRGYTSQTVSAQLQDDASITMNNLTDSIMEADQLTFQKPASDQLQFTTASGKDYLYNASENKLYLGSSVLCDNVEEFKVQIVNTGINSVPANVVRAGTSLSGNKITSINNPIQIKVTIKLKFQNEQREAVRIAGVRNKVANISVEGRNVTDYELKEDVAGYFTN